ncbi:23S rRNA (adenine(2503)-C(2))-methyltransferase RlmN [Patescibacteria group bacterium]|nr:23S rRNA (adenine(2503)-C(2))-methyltransferase RlmN [Patescibacteria group bacterium]
MLSINSLRQWLKENDFQPFRSMQIINGVFKEGKDSFQKIHTLPLNLRDQLTKKLKFLSFKVKKSESSEAGNCTKIVCELEDKKKIESVLMKFKDGRKSVCVSSQVGCPLKCEFCATGKGKYIRNLSAEEITDQALHFLLKESDKITNIVFMGMGEPFLNYENTIEAADIFNDAAMFNIAARNITFSTAGIVPGIKKLANLKKQYNLAISLHAADQELREKIMPVAKMYHLDELMESAKDYLKKTHRRITYEYIMLKDINDSDQHAKQLVNLIKGQLCHINLIPFNAHNGSKYSGTSPLNIKKFKNILEIHKIPVTIRVSLGADISGACGQLVKKNN